MWDLVKAELRDSWSAWLGVSLSFIAVSFSFALALLLMFSASASGSSDAEEMWSSLAGFNIFICVLVGLAVIGSATSLVVNSRRGSVARLALAGATPRQIVRVLSGQLSVVAVVSSVFGALAAIGVQQPIIDALSENREATEGPGEWMPAQASVLALVIAVAVTVVVAILGGRRQARRASAIPPVEALRQAKDRDKSGFRLAQIVWILVSVAIVAAWIVFTPTLAEAQPELGPGLVMQGSIFVLAMVGVILNQLAPVSIKGLTWLWTSITPITDASWHLARQTVMAKSERLAKTVVPVMFAVGLIFGFMAIGGTVQATMAATSGEVSVTGIDLLSLMMLLGLPTLISLAGAVGNLVMMSKQRDAELALDGVVGATPLQQFAIPFFEAFIITVSASILGLVMAASSVVYLAVLLPTFGYTFAWSIPWWSLAVVAGVCYAVVTLATLLPTIPSLSKPAPKVIARLIAE